MSCRAVIRLHASSECWSGGHARPAVLSLAACISQGFRAVGHAGKYASAQKLMELVQHTESDAWLALRLAAHLSLLPLTRALSCLSGSLWSRTLQARLRMRPPPPHASSTFSRACDCRQAVCSMTCSAHQRGTRHRRPVHTFTTSLRRMLLPVSQDLSGSISELYLEAGREPQACACACRPGWAQGQRAHQLRQS